MAPREASRRGMARGKSGAVHVDPLAGGQGGADHGVAGASGAAVRLGVAPGVAHPGTVNLALAVVLASEGLVSGGSAPVVRDLAPALAPGRVVASDRASVLVAPAALVLVALVGVHGAVPVRVCLAGATSSMPCSVCSRSARSTATR